MPFATAGELLMQKRQSLVVVAPGTTAVAALREMGKKDIAFLPVVEGGKLVGVVAERDIARGVILHGRTLVRDIMTPQERLEVLDMADLRTARVGHIEATLKKAGRQHALVVERDTGGKQWVRGLYSLTQIARQLGVVIQTSAVARTFSEIEWTLTR